MLPISRLKICGKNSRRKKPLNDDLCAVDATQAQHYLPTRVRTCVFAGGGQGRPSHGTLHFLCPARTESVLATTTTTKKRNLRSVARKLFTIYTARVRAVRIEQVATKTESKLSTSFPNSTPPLHTLFSHVHSTGGTLAQRKSVTYIKTVKRCKRLHHPHRHIPSSTSMMNLPHVKEGEHQSCSSPADELES